MRQLHAALQRKFRSEHIKAGKVAPVHWLEDCPEYASAKQLAAVEAVPDKGERPDRDPQVMGKMCLAQPHASHCRLVVATRGGGGWLCVGGGWLAAGAWPPQPKAQSGWVSQSRHATPTISGLQAGTVDDTLSYEQMERLMKVMLGSLAVGAMRDKSMASWMAMTIGRGDDARLVFLPDLLVPTLMRVIGERGRLLGCG